MSLKNKEGTEEVELEGTVCSVIRHCDYLFGSGNIQLLRIMSSNWTRRCRLSCALNCVFALHVPVTVQCLSFCNYCGALSIR